MKASSSNLLPGTLGPLGGKKSSSTLHNSFQGRLSVKAKYSGKSLHHFEEMRHLAIEGKKEDRAEIHSVSQKLDKLLAAFASQQEDINLIKKALNITTSKV
jgi:hypothetical protein